MRSLPNTAHDWEKMLKRVYETQGPSGFAKYQYSLASIIHLTRKSAALHTMLEYCGDIPNPKDVFIEAVCEIMLDDNVDTNAPSRKGTSRQEN